jgi:hypothetical protein
MSINDICPTCGTPRQIRQQVQQMAKAIDAHEAELDRMRKREALLLKALGLEIAAGRTDANLFEALGFPEMASSTDKRIDSLQGVVNKAIKLRAWLLEDEGTDEQRCTPFDGSSGVHDHE